MGARAERMEAREPARESAGPSPCILHTTRSRQGPTARLREGTSRSSPKRHARAVRRWKGREARRRPRRTKPRPWFVTRVPELGPRRLGCDVASVPRFAQWRRRPASRAAHEGKSLEANGCGGPIRTSLSGRLSRRRNPSYYPAQNPRFRRLRANHNMLRTQHSRASRKPRTREREGRPGRPGKTFWMDKVGVEKPSTSGVRVTRPKKEHATTHTLLPDGPLVKSAPFSSCASRRAVQLARSGASWPLSATYSEYPPP
jgi:hypothetical protein